MYIFISSSAAFRSCRFRFSYWKKLTTRFEMEIRGLYKAKLVYSDGKYFPFPGRQVNVYFSVVK